MSNEGYILTIEGCPYAFTTNGIAGYQAPASPEWALSWTMMENVLVNPNDYISWNERTLPIEGDLEVDGITLKLHDKYLENFTLYDGTSFTGNILTELFTRGSARENSFYLQRSLCSILSQSVVVNSAYDNELLLFSDPGLPGTGIDGNYNPRRISGSYDLSTTFATGQPIWIEDEAIWIIGTAGQNSTAPPVDPLVLVAGLPATGLESLQGRGYYGTENKYHRIRETYSPEIFLKHPLVIKRGVILWRVEDAQVNSVDSIYPIWRGYCQSSPELTPDGSTFALRAEHKWNTYKNELMEYSGFRNKFTIPVKTYSKSAMYAVFKSSFGFDRIIEPNFQGTYHDWITDYRIKFTDSPMASFRGMIYTDALSSITTTALVQHINEINPLAPWEFNTSAGIPNALHTVRLNFRGTPDAYLSANVPSQYAIGGSINGTVFWSNIVDRWSNVVATSPVVPEVAIDFKQNINPPVSIGATVVDNGYALKYRSNIEGQEFLPSKYLYLISNSLTTRLGGTNSVTLQHAYHAEDGESVIVMEPSAAQSDLARITNKVVCGKISRRNKGNYASLQNNGTQDYIGTPLAFESSVVVNSTCTVIETLFKSMLRSRADVTMFNNINTNDFDVSNLSTLIDWVSAIDTDHTIRWTWTEGTKFMDYIQPYMKFFSYIICLKGSKIKFNTMDPTRPVDHFLTTADFLETPVNLSTLPENLFNSMKLSAPNYETVFTFNDDLSKGRYKIGNTQEVAIPDQVGDITSVNDLIVYFQKIANRFLSIWGYPQYVFKCKTSIKKINIEIGDIVSITDWLVPDFDKDDPKRGLLLKPGIVVERNVDLSNGCINFSIAYGENFQTSYYSPCVRAQSFTDGVGDCTMICQRNYIKPSNKQQPNWLLPTGYLLSGIEEDSTYAGSNRYGYTTRYDLPLPAPPGTPDDGGVSPFNQGDFVELILRDTTIQAIFSGSGGIPLRVLSKTPAIRELKLNQNIPTVWQDAIDAGQYVDLRFSDYESCAATQQTEYGFVGDFALQSLDSPPVTPPAQRVIASTQYSP